MIRVFVYRIAILACLLIAALEASSEAAEAAEAVKPLKERWIPGFSLGLVVFEAGVGFGFLGGGELEFELVDDFDLVVDRVRRLLEIGLRVKLARGRAPDEAHEPTPFSGARAGVRSQLS